jgi:hypothetical protein
MAGFWKPFTRGEVKYFDRSEVDAAWKWLQEEGHQAPEGDDRKSGMLDEFDRTIAFPWFGG